MAKDAIVSSEMAKKFATEKDTPYLQMGARRGPRHHQRALCARPASTVELKPWARRGGKGVFINHEASRTSNDCYVCEIPPGSKLAPQRQLYEEMVLVLDGRGSTTVWNDAGQRITFEWKAGAIFAIPLNCWHQHFNGSGQKPARYVGVTYLPVRPQSLRRRRFRLQHEIRLQEPLRGRAGLFLATRASTTASCCGPISCRTRSTCR